jgi:divalent metal cation (Fe/Co/Zn/Cd) transporter
MTQALPLERRRLLHRRALRLEYFTVGWNVIEGVVAIGAGIIAGSVALVGFGVDSSIEVISALGLLWRLRKAGPKATVQEESGAERRALYVVADAAETWVCSYLSLALLAGVGLYALFGWWWADAVGALGMLPVILWQGWETLGEARETNHEDEE